MLGACLLPFSTQSSGWKQGKGSLLLERSGVTCWCDSGGGLVTPGPGGICTGAAGGILYSLLERDVAQAVQCPGFDLLTDPAQWTHFQLALFSAPTSGPQLVLQRLWSVLSCLWKSVSKGHLAVYRKD